MKLEAESGTVIMNPSEADIRRVIEAEEFAVLGPTEDTYIQFAERKEPPYDYVLEYQDGSLEKHFEAVSPPISADQVAEAFLRYLRGDASWQAAFMWRRLDLGKAVPLAVAGPCPECAVAPGTLHEMFCVLERCPFCGGQLASCECAKRVLKLTADEVAALDAYVDDSVQPLSGIVERWRRALETEGRVPWHP